MVKYNDLSVIGREKVIQRNRNYFVDKFGIPEDDKNRDHYMTDSFLNDYFKENNPEIGFDMEVLE